MRSPVQNTSNIRFLGRRRMWLVMMSWLVFLTSTSSWTLAQTPGKIATNGAAQSSQTQQQDVLDPFTKLLEKTQQANETRQADDGDASFFMSGPEKWTSRQGLSSSLQVLLLLTVLSLAPAILLMTTCYVRIIVVLGLLRTAIGTPQLPPSQVVTSIALFMTLFVMAPVWTEVYNEAIVPYTEEGSQLSLTQALEKGASPIRQFMSRQIDMAGNHDDVHLFYSHYAPNSPPPANFDEVPLRVLLPAYMLSELKTSFMMGFQIYLPFLILDIVIASVTISMGMMMLPPAMISMPFKLLLFVLLDGWRMVVQMLLDSFGTYSG